MIKFVILFMLILVNLGYCQSTQDVKVQVKFTENTAYGDFSDSLYFTESDYAKLKQKDLDILKKAKLDAWIYDKEHPAPVVPYDPAKDIIRQKVQLLTNQQNILESKLQSIKSQRESLEKKL